MGEFQGPSQVPLGVVEARLVQGDDAQAEVAVRLVGDQLEVSLEAGPGPVGVAAVPQAPGSEVVHRCVGLEGGTQLEGTVEVGSRGQVVLLLVVGQAQGEGGAGGTGPLLGHGSSQGLRAPVVAGRHGADGLIQPRVVGFRCGGATLGGAGALDGGSRTRGGGFAPRTAGVPAGAKGQEESGGEAHRERGHESTDELGEPQRQAAGPDGPRRLGAPKAVPAPWGERPGPLSYTKSRRKAPGGTRLGFRPPGGLATLEPTDIWQVVPRVPRGVALSSHRR